jgi:Kyanoviridae head maturation protease
MAMKTEILVESLSPNEANILTEAKNDGQDIWLNGILMQAEVKNRNGRIYPLGEMVNAVNEANNHIRNYNFFPGELDHPTDRLNVALDRISHVVSEIRMDGNNACGKLKLLGTPCGLIGKQLIKEGLRIGVSSRGAGEVDQATGKVNSFALYAIDLVTTPSAMGAMPVPMYEALQTKIGTKVMTLAEQLRDDKAAQKYFEKEIRKFLSEMFN